MNRNSRRKAKLLAKSFVVERKAGRNIVPPPSKRGRPWRGSAPLKTRLVATPGFHSA